MIFPLRKLARSHSEEYRQVQIPRPVSAIWIAANIEYISVEYLDKEDCMVIRPIRPKVIDQAQAKAPLKKDAKPAKEEIHTPRAHFLL